MAVPERDASHETSRSRVALPPGVRPPFEVFLNGVLQEQGRDYRLVGSELVFDRPLAREGKLGFWRWASMFLGIAGTYRRDDAVDVIYREGGSRRVLTGLPIERG